MILKGYSSVNQITERRASKLNLVQVLTLSWNSSSLSVIVCMTSFEKL